MPTPTNENDAGLRELKQKLDEEERVYAELLAALDALAVNPAPYERDPELPSLLQQLNAACDEPSGDELSPATGPRGVKSWLRGMTRRLIEPELGPLRRRLEQRRSFDSHLVQFLNRYMDVAHQRAARLEELSSTLVRFAQRIDRLADAKDRLYATLANERTDLLLEAMDKRLETVDLGLRRTRERLEGMLSSLELTRSELAALRRPAGKSRAGARPAPVSHASALESFEYVAFENRFRGSAEDIRERLARYVSHFNGAGPVVELGCGRGEFLELLRDAGIEGLGIDDNEEMVAFCQARGLAAERADLLLYLRQAKTGSLGGLFAAQVIEHLPPARLRETLDACYRVLRKGGRAVFETVNPRSVVALIESFNRDLSHEKPIHPDTLDFLLRASGFDDVGIEYTSPVSERAKLLAVPATNQAAGTLNENFRKLNALLFGDQDYAAVATK